MERLKIDYETVNEIYIIYDNKHRFLEILNIDTPIEQNSLLNFKLSNFEGPLDLLLSLIKASKMEIEDIIIYENNDEEEEEVRRKKKRVRA